jgi:chromosome segregation ATPase
MTKAVLIMTAKATNATTATGKDPTSPTSTATVFLSEAEELRECLRRTEMKCATLQRERDYHVAKAKELGNLLQDNSMEESEPCQQLIQTTAEFATLNQEANVLRSELGKKVDRIKELEHDCSTNRSVLVELSQMFRSVTSANNSHNHTHQDLLRQLEESRRKKEEDHDNSKEEDDNRFRDHSIILSPQQALDLTLSTLREQIEALEDERQSYIGRIRSLQKFLEEQRRENEARELKIMALERQMEEFWKENLALKEFLDNSIDTIQAVEEADDVMVHKPTNKKKATLKSGKKFGWRVRNIAKNRIEGF